MARILIVDDDPQTLDLLHFSLTLQGHETIRATDGVECIAAVRDHRPDLIVLDQIMPVMTGTTAMLALRGDPATANVPVIMVTSRRSDRDVWSGYQAGVSSYIAKPVDLDVLEWEIDRLLEASPATFLPTAPLRPE